MQWSKSHSLTCVQHIKSLVFTSSTSLQSFVKNAGTFPDPSMACILMYRHSKQDFPGLNTSDVELCLHTFWSFCSDARRTRRGDARAVPLLFMIDDPPRYAEVRFLIAFGTYYVYIFLYTAWKFCFYIVSRCIKGIKIIWKLVRDCWWGSSPPGPSFQGLACNSWIKYLLPLFSLNSELYTPEMR